MLAARPLRLWPQTLSSTSPPGAAVRGGRCASAPAWPHPALPALARVEPAPGAAWARPPPASPRRLPHAQRPRLGHAQTLGGVPGRGHARPPLGLGDPRGGGDAAAGPRVRPRAARRELSVPGTRGRTRRGAQSRSCTPGADPRLPLGAATSRLGRLRAPAPVRRNRRPGPAWVPLLCAAASLPPRPFSPGGLFLALRSRSSAAQPQSPRQPGAPSVPYPGKAGDPPGDCGPEEGALSRTLKVGSFPQRKRSRFTWAREAAPQRATQARAPHPPEGSLEV